MPLCFDFASRSGWGEKVDVANLQGIREGDNVDVVALCAHHLHVPIAKLLDVYVLIHHPLQPGICLQFMGEHSIRQKSSFSGYSAILAGNPRGRVKPEAEE